MAESHFLFSRSARVGDRVITDYGKMTEIVDASKRLGMSVVLTMGAFDLFHEGHARYLEAAHRHGDLLIVGVDNDEKVRERKGPRRPLVSEQERMEILCHCRHVDITFLKKLGDPKWELIRTVQPDTLIATQGTYTPEQIQELEEKYCRKVIVLPHQSATSTTARMRLLLMGTTEEIQARVEATFAELNRFFTELKGGHQ